MNIRVEEHSDVTVWDDLVREHGGHPLQLFGWGDVKSGFDWRAIRLSFTDSSDQVVAVAQVLIRKLPWPFRALAYVPRGPVFADHVSDEQAEEVLNSLVTHIRKEAPGVMGISIEPDREEFFSLSKWRHTDNEILPSLTIRLNLSQTEEDLQKAMPKKTRQYIRKSERELSEIRPGTEADLIECFRIYEDTASRADFALRSEEYYRRVWDAMGEANRLYMAMNGEKPVAFLWNALSDTVAFELYGGMDETGQKLRANYALKWFAIRDAKHEGNQIYDMGGLIDGGVSTFKRSWTDHDSQLVGTLEYQISWRLKLWDRALPLAKRILKRFR